MDRIGIFKGKPISEMTRDELLDFAEWAGKEISRLIKIEGETEDFRLCKEAKDLLAPTEPKE